MRAGALLVDVAAAPERGKANAELLRWARRAFATEGSPEVRAGAASRVKVLFLPGTDEAGVRARLRALL